MSEGYQGRVVTECEELVTKMNKLTDFIDSEEYKILPLMEKERLHTQLFHMGKYEAILAERIEYFEETS